MSYRTVNPFVIVAGAEDLIGFLGEVFDGTEQERISRADGTVGHAEVAVGDSVVMLTEATPELPARSAAFYVFVADVDDCYRRALATGATSRREPADQFYGNREAGVVDRWGNIWWIATVIEQVAPEELQARYDATV